MYSRKLVKNKKSGQDNQAVIAKMNEMIQDYAEKSKPAYCAKLGMMDEVVELGMLRNYIVAFTESAYQNPESICPVHQMITPRVIKDYNNRK